MKTMKDGFWVITSGDSESSANAWQEKTNKKKNVLDERVGVAPHT